MTVALFSDLRHPKQHFSDAEAGAQRKGSEIKAFDDQIFSECTEFNLSASGAEFFDLFIGKQAYLSVPISGMGIALDSPVFF